MFPDLPWGYTTIWLYDWTYNHIGHIGKKKKKKKKKIIYKIGINRKT